MQAGRSVAAGALVVAFMLAGLSGEVAVAAPAGTASPGWLWQRGSVELQAVFFADSSRGWAVGTRGEIVATTDGGVSWWAQRSGVYATLFDVHFADADSGFAVGGTGTVLRTTDGGATWSLLATPTQVDLWTVFARDAQHVWVGGGNVVLLSSDGGATWQTVTPGVSKPVRKIQMLDASNGVLIAHSGGFADSSGSVMWSADGGLTWNRSTSSETWANNRLGDRFDFDFPSPDLGVFVGNYTQSYILLSADRGRQDWTYVDLGAFAEPGLFALDMLDSTHGIALGYDPIDGYSARKTGDGGRTWPLAACIDKNDVAMLSRDVAVSVGYNGVGVTRDGAGTWSRPAAFDASYEPLVDVTFPTDTDGWTVGYQKGKSWILHSSDGGRTWEQQHEAPAILNAVAFVDENRGWAVGFSGTILATTDGGQRWVAQTTGLGSELKGLSALDASRAWICGGDWSQDSRGVWRTTNGGSSWTLAASPTEIPNGIQMLDATTGFLVGGTSKAKVFKTTDGGTTWVEKPLGGSFQPLKDVCFRGASEGWVVGGSGLVAHTTDGGETWQLQASGTGSNLSRIAFLDATHGYAVGDNAIVMTSDGGQSWSLDTTTRVSGASGVTCRPSGWCWLVGQWGTIRVLEGQANPMPHVRWLEVAAHQPGKSGSQWRSDLVARNRGSAEASVQLVLHRAAGNQTLGTSVAAGAQGIFEDVVSLMGLSDAKGSLEVRSSEAVDVVGRTYNQAAGGTFGQYTPAYAPDEALATGDAAWLLGLRQVEGTYRTNLNVANVSAVEAKVKVTLYRTAGGELKAYELTVPAGQLVQDQEPIKARAGQPSLGWAFARVEVISGTGILTSASVVDSRTNDATTIPMRR